MRQTAIKSWQALDLHSVCRLVADRAVLHCRRKTCEQIGHVQVNDNFQARAQFVMEQERPRRGRIRWPSKLLSIGGPTTDDANLPDVASIIMNPNSITGLALFHVYHPIPWMDVMLTKNWNRGQMFYGTHIPRWRYLFAHCSTPLGIVQQTCPEHVSLRDCSASLLSLLILPSIVC